MDRQDVLTLIKLKFNNILLLLFIAGCIAVTLYVNLIMGIDVVYTHLFYIPIILAGVLYYRKAVFLALFLGLAHVAIGYYIDGYIVLSTLLRAAIFVLIAYVIGYLAENKDRLYDDVRRLLESTDEGIYGVDDRGRCTFINRSALRILGYSRGEVLGRNMHALIHHTRPDGRPCGLDECCVVRSFQVGTGCRNSDDIFWRKDGTSFPVEYSANPVIGKDAPTGVVVIFTDISERKKAEAETLDARRQAEFYVDLMGHDINNMNQAGIGYLELALETLKLGDEEREYLLRPLEALFNSSRLIDTVRKLQVVQEGHVKHEKIDMCRLLQDVISQCSAEPGRNVAINFEQASGCFVMADELLKDVFMNIIGNAIKHSSGPLAIDIDMDEVSDDGKDYYRVGISDNGPGIPDGLKKKLFTRFQRGETRATGRGLGLYLVKRLVDTFHGRVWAEDRVPGDPTKGSRFVVMLPALTSSPS